MLCQSKVLLEGLKMLEELEKSSGISHDDLRDHDDDKESEFDIILIPEMDDLFDKKEIKLSVANNIYLFDKYPNSILMSDTTSSSIKNKSETSKQKNVEINKPETTEDIWQVLDQIKKDNANEDITNMTSDNTEDTAEATENNDIICKGCNSRNTLIEDQHSSCIVCSHCGFVNEELFDNGPEWRQYNNDDNRGEGVNRCGCPSNFFFPKSSQGTIITGSSSSRLKRKQKWNSMVYKERSLNIVFEKISQICGKNNIPKIIVDTAKILYKKLSDCKHKNGNNVDKQIIIRGENRTSIIAACVFRACEMNKNPRSIKEIAEMFEMDEKKVTRGKKQFDKIMKNIDDNSLRLDQIKTNTPEDFIRRHANRLKLTKENTDIAVKIAHNCCKMKLASDHNPQSIAAGSVLLMVNYCDIDIEKKRIAKLFGTSDVTVGKIYNKIYPYVDALVDDEATNYIIEKFKING